MLRKLRSAIKGQSTPEYAILIALVVAAVIAMQTYAKRAIQAKVRDASDFLVQESGSLLGNEEQYEPYYLESNFQVNREQLSQSRQDINLVATNASTNVIRASGGSQVYTNAVNGE